MKYRLLTCMVLILVLANPSLAALESEDAGIKRLVTLTKAQSYMKATSLLDQMVEADPTNPRLRLVGAQLYRQMGMFARSMTEYKQLMKSDPNMVEPVIALSQMYMEYLNLPQSLTLARQAVGMNPTNKEARIALCSALIASDYLKDAGDQLGKLQKQSGSDPEINYVAYKLYLKRGQLAKAREQLEIAMTLDPSNGQWLLDLSELYKLQGDYQQAYQCLQRALYADPLSVEKLNRMAIMQEYFLRDYDQAMLQYKRILQIDPDSVTAMAGLDRCKSKKNDIAGMLKVQIRTLFANLIKFLFPAQSR